MPVVSQINTGTKCLGKERESEREREREKEKEREKGGKTEIVRESEREIRGLEEKRAAGGFYDDDRQ